MWGLVFLYRELSVPIVLAQRGFCVCVVASQYLQYGDDPLAWTQLRHWNAVVTQHAQTISEAAAGKKRYTTDIPIELIKGVQTGAFR